MARPRKSVLLMMAVSFSSSARLAGGAKQTRLVKRVRGGRSEPWAARRGTVLEVQTVKDQDGRLATERVSLARQSRVYNV
jgi:hypothetical protein